MPGPRHQRRARRQSGWAASSIMPDFTAARPRQNQPSAEMPWITRKDGRTKAKPMLRNRTASKNPPFVRIARSIATMSGGVSGAASRSGGAMRA